MPDSHSQPLHEVHMFLTDSDVENAERITSNLRMPNNAQTVSFALALARFVTGRVLDGDDLLLMRPDGTLERIRMVELDKIRKPHLGDTTGPS
jgi:hypothetical protein